MKVILKADIKGSGKAGELVSVSDGYARNYLLPRGLAVEADSKALNELHGREEAARHRTELEKQQAEQAAKKLGGATVRLTAKAGQGGKLFGSVTAKEIAAAISQQFGLGIDKRRIVLDSDIKAFGTYEVEIKLYHGISASIRVAVGE